MLDSLLISELAPLSLLPVPKPEASWRHEDLLCCQGNRIGLSPSTPMP